ncbi:MAG TPA: PilW family protein [Candidatus Obscuribacterales bacterium]
MTFMKRSMQPPSRQDGLTLIELMVALVIGLFLVIGLVFMLVSMSRTRTELDRTSRQIENGRYALQLLTTDVQHAGFLGTYTPRTATYTAPAPCTTAAWATMADLGFVNTFNVEQVPVFVYGYDGATASPACVTNRVAGTDILVVRRVSTTSIAPGSPQYVAGETYLQVNACAPLNPAFVVSKTAGDFTLQQKDCAAALAPLRKYVVRLYYVSSCNVCDGSEDPPIPTLKMVDFVNGAMTVTPLVEGIQNLQLDYGIDTNNDGSPDCYVTDPGAAAAPACAGAPYVWEPNIQNWANIVAVRIHVLARNILLKNEGGGGWTDTKTYDLGIAGTVGPFNDQYRRHVHSAVARVINVASRRETP